ncbi:hypothetical protein VTN02DRAFT_4536 [Thermoascus thermophilus]
MHLPRLLVPPSLVAPPWLWHRTSRLAGLFRSRAFTPNERPLALSERLSPHHQRQRGCLYLSRVSVRKSG